MADDIPTPRAVRLVEALQDKVREMAKAKHPDNVNNQIAYVAGTYIGLLEVLVSVSSTAEKFVVGALDLKIDA